MQRVDRPLPGEHVVVLALYRQTAAVHRHRLPHRPMIPRYPDSFGNSSSFSARINSCPRASDPTQGPASTATKAAIPITATRYLMPASLAETPPVLQDCEMRIARTPIGPQRG